MKNDAPNLPAPVAGYFSAETSDPKTAARFFAEDGVVFDEGHTHAGRAAISRWKSETMKKYHYTSQPLTAKTSGSVTTVQVRLKGSFPGSPIEVRQRFTLKNDAISRLEIG